MLFREAISPYCISQLRNERMVPSAFRSPHYTPQNWRFKLLITFCAKRADSYRVDKDSSYFGMIWTIEAAFNGTSSQSQSLAESSGRTDTDIRPLYVLKSGIGVEIVDFGKEYIEAILSQVVGYGCISAQGLCGAVNVRRTHHDPTPSCASTRSASCIIADGYPVSKLQTRDVDATYRAAPDGISFNKKGTMIHPSAIIFGINGKSIGRSASSTLSDFYSVLFSDGGISQGRVYPQTLDILQANSVYKTAPKVDIASCFRTRRGNQIGFSSKFSDKITDNQRIRLSNDGVSRWDNLSIRESGLLNPSNARIGNTATPTASTATTRNENYEQNGQKLLEHQKSPSVNCLGQLKTLNRIGRQAIRGVSDSFSRICERFREQIHFEHRLA